MSLSFAALEPGIKDLLSQAQLTKPVQTKKLVDALLMPHKARFLAVQTATGVPALWLMPVFYREKPSFNAYFGNGDPLNAVTTHVPIGRGPFAGETAWEDGAIDALTLDHMSSVGEWTWARMTYQWELWNGMGPRQHGRSSGYVWSWTNQYGGGKYIHDGPGGWSPGTWDQQCGCVAIARMLVTEDPSFEEALAPVPVA